MHGIVGYNSWEYKHYLKGSRLSYGQLKVNTFIALYI